MTIAVVQGAAMAGGAGLLATCDLSIAEPAARIGFPETRRGLVAALVMAILHRRLCGRYLSELLLLAEPISATRAWEMGLVNRLVPLEKLGDESLLLADQILKGAPKATLRTKQLLEPLSLVMDLDKALSAHLEARESAEAAEGIRAFLEKRPPCWPT